MHKLDRLVVLGSTLTALSLVRAAARKGIRVALVDTRSGIAMESRRAEMFAIDSADDKVLDCLAALASRGPTALIADNDGWLRFIARHHAALGQMFAEVLHPGTEALDICLDKSRFLDWCNAHEFLAPKRYALTGSSLKSPPPFPLLLRPERTRHGEGLPVPKAVEVHDEAQLRYWLERFEHAGVDVSTAQSLLRPGIRQYSVGFARDRSGRTRLVVAEKIRSLPDQCAGGTFVIESHQPEVAAFVRRFGDEIGYFGVAEAEVMRDDSTGENFLIEVNARPWVQFAISERAGGDFLGFLMRDAPMSADTLRRPVRWLNFEADMYGCFARDTGVVRNGRIRWSTYIRSLLLANTFAVWDWHDPGPFLRQTTRFVVGRLFPR